MGKYDELVNQAVTELGRLEADHEATSEQHIRAVHTMERAIRLRDDRATLADYFLAEYPNEVEDGAWRVDACPGDLFAGDSPTRKIVDKSCGLVSGCAENCPLWDKTIDELEAME